MGTITRRITSGGLAPKLRAALVILGFILCKPESTGPNATAINLTA